MLATNRHVIADILANLAHDQFRRPSFNPDKIPGRGETLFNGAATLRWIEGNGYDLDAPDCDELNAQVEQLQAAMESVEAALDDWMADKLAKPAAFRDRLLKILVTTN